MIAKYALSSFENAFPVPKHLPVIVTDWVCTAATVLTEVTTGAQDLIDR
jgi:hypothetical protein